MKWIFVRTVRLLNPDMIVLLGDLVSSQLIPNNEFQQRAARLRWIFDLPSGHENTEIVWLAGNHDIGYGSDCTTRRLKRFVDEFGEQNKFFEVFGHYWLMFNSQVLENARVERFHNETLEFIENVGDEYLQKKGTSDEKPLIILDHIPMYKPKGHCVDSPTISTDNNGFVTSQTMLSSNVTDTILKLQPTWIFNGHDHNGCFYEHKSDDNHLPKKSL